MHVPFARGLVGREGARAVSSKRADLGDRPTWLVGVRVGVALQAGGRGFETLQLHEGFAAAIDGGRPAYLSVPSLHVGQRLPGSVGRWERACRRAPVS